LPRGSHPRLSLRAREELLSLLEGVTDGESVARDARRTEVQVVVDEIESGLGADEKSAFGIELNAGAEVPHEVFVGHKVSDAIAATGTVEAGVERADAAGQLKIRMAREFGRVNGVEVKKDWTKREGRVASVATLAFQ